LWRHDSEDRHALIMQRDRSAQHRWIAIEGALPETIADHDNGRRADLIFVFTEGAANFCRQTNDVEKISRDRRARDAFRFATRNAAQVSRFLMGRSEMFKNRVVMLPVEVVG